MLAINLIGKPVPTISITSTLGEARSFFDEGSSFWQHLPVLEGDKFMGLLPAGETYKGDPFSLGATKLLPVAASAVHDFQSIYEIIKKFKEQALSLLPVIDQAGKYLGSILITDLVDKVYWLTAAGQPGGVIVLEINEREVSLVEILKIVESNNAHVLSLFTENLGDSLKVLVTFKVNKTDLGAIKATFERFNYQIRFSFENDTFADDSQDRFESFMNYLKM